MQKRYLIGIDLGTSGIRAALYQICGKIIYEASVELPLFHPKPGVVGQEIQGFYTSAAQPIHQCIGSSGIDHHEIAAIAFDSKVAREGLIREDYQL